MIHVFTVEKVFTQSMTVNLAYFGFLYELCCQKQKQSLAKSQACKKNVTQILSIMKRNEKLPIWYVGLACTCILSYPFVAIISKSPISIHIKAPGIDYQIESGETPKTPKMVSPRHIDERKE